MKAPKEHRLTALVGEIAPTGEGVVLVEHRGERRAVFVRGAAFGDELKLAVDFERRPARGRILAVAQPSPSRVPAECPDASRCGGCDYMQIARDSQIELHAAHARAALPAAFGDQPVSITRAAVALRYRTRARLHVRVSGGRAVVGFFAPETHHPVETGTCVVLAVPLDHARAAVGALLEGAVGQGEARLALGVDRKPVLDLTWDHDLPGSVFSRAEQGVANGTWAGLRFITKGSSRPAVVGDPTPWIAGADGEPLELAPGGFAQASEEMNVVLARYVAEQVPAGLRVVELYAGAGNFSVLLARAASKLIAVESDAPSCEAAQRNLERRGLRATVVAQDASEYAAFAADVVVLDPPRTGAAKMAAALAKTNIKRIVYVSCDTRTLARDLATLSAGYDIARVAGFEMFPHTSHVETVVTLVKRRPS